MDQVFDVVVLGGGAAGEVAAGRLSDGGLSVALVERELVGGECSYWACMPAKALLRPGRVLAEVRRVPGARQAVSGEVELSEVLRRRDELASHWEDEGQVAWLDGHDVSLIRGHGRLEGERTVSVARDDGERVLLTAERAVIVATGTRAAVPDVEGATDVSLWDNRTAMAADRAPESMLVMGGGAAGVETAQAWKRLGAGRVIVVESEERLLHGEEEFAGEALAERFVDEGIQVLTRAQVTHLSRGDAGTILLRLGDGSRHEVAVVVSAVGRDPATHDIGLERVGMEPGEWLDVDESLRTAAHPEWLYAVGDVNGEDLLTHAGKYEARIAADVILGESVTVDRGRSGVPRVVFTDPLIAAAGYTLDRAREAGIDAEARDISVGSQAEAKLWGEDVHGEARFIIDRDRRVLVGATFTGPSSLAEMLVGAQIAILSRIPVDDFRHLVPQFPTFSELWLGLSP